MRRSAVRYLPLLLALAGALGLPGQATPRGAAVPCCANIGLRASYDSDTGRLTASWDTSGTALCASYIYAGYGVDGQGLVQGSYEHLPTACNPARAPVQTVNGFSGAVNWFRGQTLPEQDFYVQVAFSCVPPFPQSSVYTAPPSPSECGGFAISNWYYDGIWSQTVRVSVARCRVPNVVGLSAQAARARLRAAGCLGTVLRKTTCVSPKGRFAARIGKVRSQQPGAGTSAPARQEIVITVGIACAKGNKQPSNSLASFNGAWTARFQVQSSTSPLARPGQVLTGIDFAVKNRRIKGDLSGTISAAGRKSPDVPGLILHDADVISTLLGISCQGTLSFWIYHGKGQAGSEAGITCSGGKIRIVGDFRATQTKRTP